MRALMSIEGFRNLNQDIQTIINKLEAVKKAKKDKGDDITSTEKREHSLKDVITQLEPDLFRKVTALTLRDFELLVSLNLFNSVLMNDAIYKFKRYEDSSLEYIGINNITHEYIGMQDTVISRAEFKR